MGNCDIDSIEKQLGFLKLLVSIVIGCCVATSGGAWKVSVVLNELNAKNDKQDSRDAEIATRLDTVDKNGTTYGREITSRRNEFERRVIEDLATIKQQLRDKR